MNYLAHAYLSFNNPAVLVGNMISDFVKGKDRFRYPATIGIGIQLHRDIDRFTDSHPATRAISALFKPHYRLYSGAIADVLYDYYLANDTTHFETEAVLQQFAQQTYLQLYTHASWLPGRFASMLPYMQSQNWLYNYRFHWGIQKSLIGLSSRAAYMPDSNQAFEIFAGNEAYCKEQYQLFMGDIKKYAADTFAQLSKP